MSSPKTTGLRELLDAAVAKKAAEDAAAAAAAEAQREAEAAAAAAAAANTPDGAKATARQLAAERGWGADQFSCLESLWNRESGWNYQAYNSRKRRHRHPPVPARQQDGERRRGLADERVDPDPLGSRLHRRVVWLALRRVGSFERDRLVLIAAGGAAQTPPPPPPPPPPPADPPPPDPPDDEDDDEDVLADSVEIPDENDDALKPLVPAYQVGELPAP